MDDLIDRQALIKQICGERCGCYISECGFDEPCQYVRYVNDAPAVDAVPVAHGKWIREDETQALLSVMWHCSECEIPLEMNGIYTPLGAGYKYCPNCGAKMDGKETE